MEQLHVDVKKSEGWRFWETQSSRACQSSSSIMFSRARISSSNHWLLRQMLRACVLRWVQMMSSHTAVFFFYYKTEQEHPRICLHSGRSVVEGSTEQGGRLINHSKASEPRGSILAFTILSTKRHSWPELSQCSFIHHWNRIACFCLIKGCLPKVLEMYLTGLCVQEGMK